jgi:RNA polymerase sigma-70 factor (ECF subfamily)
MPEPASGELAIGWRVMALQPPRQSASPDHLVREARQGSEVAVEALIRANWRRAYATAYLIVGNSADAEDIAQEALWSALNGLDGFDERKPLDPWLHRIVVNRCLDALRSRKTRSELPLVADPAASEQPGASSVISDEALAAAVVALPVEQRTVVVLRHALGFPTEEIAEILGVPRGTVGSRLRRALDELRLKLEERTL